VKRVLAMLGAATIFASLALYGCPPADGGKATQGTSSEAGTPIDTELMAYLSAARALHHQANLKEDGGDLPGAIAAMNRLVGLQRPFPGRTVPEIEEVLADAYARLAELRLKNDQTDDALKDIAQGLAHAKEPTYFRGHLVEVQGIVEEARYRMLADAGKKDEADKAKARAIQLLDEAVNIQRQVIERTLGDAGDAGRE
jgi:tetratricopeptide (TPR) repeat protein